MVKKQNMCFVSGLLILLLCCMSVFHVFGAVSCNLTLNCVLHHADGMVMLSGDEYGIVKIADCAVSPQGDSYSFEYDICDEYASFDCDWSSLNVSQLREKAISLSQFVKEHFLPIDTAVVDSSGQAVFSNLDMGYYLVMRTKVSHSDYEFEPYLITVPQVENGQLIYDVISTPKFYDKSIPVVPGDFGDIQLPQTGMLFWPVIVFFIAGVLFICLGIIFMKREKKNENK